MARDHLVLLLQQGILLGQLLGPLLQFPLLVVQDFRLPGHFLPQLFPRAGDGTGVPHHEQACNQDDEQDGENAEPPALVQDGPHRQELLVLGQDVPFPVDRADLNPVFSARYVTEFDVGVVSEDGGPVLVPRQDPAFVGDVRRSGIGQVGEFQDEVQVRFVLADGIDEREVVEHVLRVIPGDGDVGLVPVFIPDETGAQDAEAFLLAEVEGAVAAFRHAVFAECHGFESVLETVAGDFPRLRVEAGESVLGRNPQVDAIDQQAVDLVVRQPVVFRIDRNLRCFRQAFVHPVQALAVGAAPENVSVGNERQAAGESRDNPVVQGFQVDDVDASDAAHPQFVRHEAFSEAGARLHGIEVIG